jgi:predicted nucleic acid-binding protein
VKICMDVSCLNRPFDDQSQPRIRLEAEATTLILEQCEQGAWEQVSSMMARIEIDAMPDADRRARVLLLLPDDNATLQLTPEVFARAAIVQTLGFKAADAVHVAAAESLEVDALLSCDDRMCRLAKRRRTQLKVRVANPLDWLKEIGHDPDAR